jgi:hypothetical protein
MSGFPAGLCIRILQQQKSYRLASLILPVVYMLSINYMRKKGYLKKKIIPIWVTSANDDRWPQDLLIWHLYLAADLPPTSLSTLHNVHPPVCNPWLLARRTIYIFLLLFYLTSPNLGLRGRESVRYLGPHPSHIAPHFLSNICQSLTVISNPMYWNTTEPNLYRSLLPMGISICTVAAESFRPKNRSPAFICQSWSEY